MRDLQLHRRGVGEALRRRRRGAPAGKPDLVGDEPHAPRAPAGAVAGRAKEPGAGVFRPRAWFLRAACNSPGRSAGRMWLISDEIGFSSRCASSPPPKSFADASSMKL